MSRRAASRPHRAASWPLHELQVDRDGDVVADGLATAGQVRVPADAEVVTVDDRLERDGDALVAVEVRRRAGQGAGRLERLGDALEGELALDGRVLTVDGDVVGAEVDRRVLLGV